MAGNENWNVPIVDLPNTGEVWGMEGYGLEGRPDDEWGLFVGFNIDGRLRAVGFTTASEVTDEVRAKAVDKCLKSVENSWLCTVPDIFERDHVCHPGYWVGTSRHLLGQLTEAKP